MGEIKIKGIKVYAYHGDLKEEQKLGGHFLVDVLLEFDSSNVEKSDDLEDTVDYVKLISIVEEQMAIRSNMIEHVAARIADQILTLNYVHNVEVEVEKLNVPIDSNFTKISAKIKRDK